MLKIVEDFIKRGGLTPILLIPMIAVISVILKYASNLLIITTWSAYGNT